MNNVSYSNLYSNQKLTFIATQNIPPLTFWKDREAELPRLAAIARDMLCIAAAGVGIERVFNIGRDICHYRRSKLSPQTIRSLMIKYCYDHKESDHLKDAQCDKIAEEVSLSQTEAEEELKQRLEAVERAMQKGYISDEDIDDFEEDSPKTQHYRKRPRNVFQQELRELTPEASTPQNTFDPRGYDGPSSSEDYGLEDKEDEEGEEDEEDEEDEDEEELELPPHRYSRASVSPISSQMHLPRQPRLSPNPQRNLHISSQKDRPQKARPQMGYLDMPPPRIPVLHQVVKPQGSEEDQQQSQQSQNNHEKRKNRTGVDLIKLKRQGRV